MKEYRIKRERNKGSMIISNRETGKTVSESMLTPGRETAEIAAMRRSLDRNLSTPGATLDNLQF